MADACLISSVSTSAPRKRGDRHDATRVDLGRGFAAMFPFLMKGRNDSIAYYPVTIEVENLLDHLDRKGLAEHTLVIYVCDNGWIQDPDADRYAPRSKQSPYEGGLRTPIMVRWPAKVKPQRSDSLAMSIDLMPTLLHAVGLKPTKDMQGINLLDTQAVKSRNTIYGECFTHNSMDLHKPAASLRWPSTQMPGRPSSRAAVTPNIAAVSMTAASRMRTYRRRSSGSRSSTIG